ncbi:MAG: carboxyl transferase domain-containing protein, partial [Gammaproteobacteria bacterium]
MAKDDQANDPYGIAKLRERKSRAYAMGGEQKVADQARLGRLNARERIDVLLDDDSFQEIGLLAHSDRPEDREKTPADGKITGFGEIEGRGVYVAADDTTVKAGSYGLVAHKKSSEGIAYAIEKGYPVINLGE